MTQQHLVSTAGGGGQLTTALPVGSLPVGSLPLGSLPTGTIPVGPLPIASLPVGSLPVGSLPVGAASQCKKMRKLFNPTLLEQVS